MPPILTQQAFLKATATSFFFFASLNCFFLLPLYVAQLGGTEVAVGVVMGVYSAIGIVCQPLIGPWVDALGRRPFMILGTVLVVLSSFLAFVATGVAMLGIVRALQGLGFSAFFVANYSYVLDLVPIERRGWALGIYGLSGMASTALAPLFGEMVIRRFGFRPLFVACGLLALITCAIVWTLRERERVDVPTAPDWASIRTMLEDVLHRHMAITVFFGLGSGTIFAFLPTFGDSIGVRTLALFYIAYACAAMGVRVVAGHWIDTRGRRAVIVPSMFLQAGGAVALAALAFLVARVSGLPPLPVLFVAGLVSGGAHGFLYPGLAALVADHAHEARRGTVIGVFSAVFLIGNSGGAFAFGYVAHRFGYGPMWATLTGLLLAGALLSLGLRDQLGGGLRPPSDAPRACGPAPLPPPRPDCAGEARARTPPIRSARDGERRRRTRIAPNADRLYWRQTDPAGMEPRHDHEQPRSRHRARHPHARHGRRRARPRGAALGEGDGAAGGRGDRGRHGSPDPHAGCAAGGQA